MIWRLLALLAALAAGPAAAEDRGRFVEWAAVPTTRIPPPRVTIWLPPGHDTEGNRHPVAYLHDGQTVFVARRAGSGQSWAADRAALSVAAAEGVAPIIVAIDAPGAARWRTYFPQALRADASPALKAVLDTKAGGPLLGDAYLAFLVHELKPLVDRSFRTRPGPADTAIIGASMGGLISCHAFIRYPRVFGRAACLSSHWPLAEPEALPHRTEVIGLWQRYFARHLGRPAGRRLWMDHGTEQLDALYAPYQRPIDTQIAARGWRRGRDVETRVYPGTGHEEKAWGARLGAILAWLFR